MKEELGVLVHTQAQATEGKIVLAVEESEDWYLESFHFLRQYKHTLHKRVSLAVVNSSSCNPSPYHSSQKVDTNAMRIEEIH